MTEKELLKILDPQQGSGALLMGKQMKDVAFYPLSINVTDTHYELGGIWYSNVFNDLMSHNGKDPARETIKIKKEDLVNWTTKADHTAK